MASRFGFAVLVLVAIPLGPAFVFATPPAAQSADLKKGMAKCAEFGGELERLACFDKLADQNGLKKKTIAKAVAGAGRWAIEETKNPLDDTKTIMTSLASESGRSRWGRAVTLAIRCQSKKLDAFIDWNSFLGSESVSVTTRIDSDAAKASAWGLSTDSQAAFMPKGELPQFMSSIVKAKRFVAQVTPYSDNPITAIFDLKGIPRVVEQLAVECEIPTEAPSDPEPVVVPGAP